MMDEKALAYVFGREEASADNQVQLSVLEQLIGPAIESVDTSVPSNGAPVTSMRFKGTLKELSEALQSVFLGSLERQKEDLEKQFEQRVMQSEQEHLKQVDSLNEEIAKLKADAAFPTVEKDEPVEVKAEVLDGVKKAK